MSKSCAAAGAAAASAADSASPRIVAEAMPRLMESKSYIARSPSRTVPASRGRPNATEPPSHPANRRPTVPNGGRRSKRKSRIETALADAAAAWADLDDRQRGALEALAEAARATAAGELVHCSRVAGLIRRRTERGGGGFTVPPPPAPARLDGAVAKIPQNLLQITRKIGRIDILPNGQFRSPPDVTLAELLSLALEFGVELKRRIRAMARNEAGDYVIHEADRECRGHVFGLWEKYCLAASVVAGSRHVLSGPSMWDGLVGACRDSMFLWPKKRGGWREVITAEELDRFEECLELYRSVLSGLDYDEEPAHLLPGALAQAAEENRARARSEASAQPERGGSTGVADADGAEAEAPEVSEGDAEPAPTRERVSPSEVVTLRALAKLAALPAVHLAQAHHSRDAPGGTAIGAPVGDAVRGLIDKGLAERPGTAPAAALG